jgi:mannose-6-phosphate isomerase-like protein (cupin superfamily)
VELVHARGGGAIPYHANVAQLTRDNELYRRVLFTGDKSQLVAMSIAPGDDIGQETHARVEQTIVCLSGSGRLSLDGVESSFGPGDVVVITPGTRHDVRNVGTAPLKLYTIYVPPNHIDQRTQATKADAQADHEDEAFGRRVE